MALLSKKPLGVAENGALEPAEAIVRAVALELAMADAMIVHVRTMKAFIL